MGKKGFPRRRIKLKPPARSSAAYRAADADLGHLPSPSGSVNDPLMKFGKIVLPENGLGNRGCLTSSNAGGKLWMLMIP